MRNGISKLTAPTPIYTLVWLRFAMGLLGGFDILGNGIHYHWQRNEFADFTFRYYGFEWVQPLPEPFFSIYFIIGCLAGIAVAIGWRFRFTAPLFALCFTYLFLLEKAHYLNHAYLFTWLAWLLVLTPAWREWSLDVRRQPGQRTTLVPAWTVYLFPLIMGIVYFFGGINKINHDWLIEAMPMKMWLQSRQDWPVLGPVFADDRTAYIMSWGGMLLDLSAPFLLLHRRLRWVALSLLIAFHALNHIIFNIGIFPYLSMVLTSLFFAPDWPYRFLQKLRIIKQNYPRIAGAPAKPLRLRAALLSTAIIVILHGFLPLRHHLFASDVNWSEEGHRYSWRMMLRSKQGVGHFTLHDPNTGKIERINPRDSLTSRQYRKMATHPDMILQYAHHLRDHRPPATKVYGYFKARLNGRKRRILIDPSVDLAQVEWTWFRTEPWIVPEDNLSHGSLERDSDRPDRK